MKVYLYIREAGSKIPDGERGRRYPVKRHPMDVSGRSPAYGLSPGPFYVGIGCTHLPVLLDASEVPRAIECVSAEYRSDDPAILRCFFEIVPVPTGEYKPPKCGKCGDEKSYDLFKGEYCRRCNLWC